MAVVHSPTRMCVGCHKKFPQSTLKRFTTKDQIISYDTTVKEPGRGSYICSAQCEQSYQHRKQRNSTKKQRNTK